MKKENIKLHSNIMKIFKYLVFIIAFLLIGVVGLQENVEAKDQTLVMYNDDFIKATGKDNNNTYKGNVYYKRDDSGSWDGSKNPFNALVIVINSTVWVDLGDAYLKVCAYGDTDYSSSTCLARKTLSYGPGTKDVSDSLIINLHFNKNVEVEEKCKNCKTDTFNFYDYISPFAKKGKKYRLWIDLPTTVTGAFNAKAIPTRFYLDTGLFVGPTATINDDSSKEYAKSHTVTINTTITPNHPEATVSTSYRKYCWSTYSNLKIIPSRSKNYLYNDNGDSCYLSSVGTSKTSFTKSNGSGTYYFYYVTKDADDEHYSVARSSAHYFDNTAPSISIEAPGDASTWKKSHSVSGISVTDSHSGVKSKQYCWKASSTTPGSTDTCWTNFTGDSVTGRDMTGKYYLHVKVSDNAGNVEYGKTSSAMYFDNEAPTITNLTVDSSSWAKSHTVSGMTFSDNNRSGVNNSTKYYCWKGSSTTPGSTDRCWKSFTGSSVTGSDMTGSFYLHIQVSDNLGNVGYAKTSSAMYFDNEAPTVTIESVSNSRYWAKNHTARIGIVDNHSGNNTLYYCWSASTATCTGTTVSMTISGKSDTKSISGNTSMNGSYYLRVWAKDNVGNTSTAITSEQIKFDNTSPIITLQTIQEWRKSHTVNFRVTDDYSGVSAVKYCINQIETMAYSSSNSCWKPVTLSSGNGSLTFDGATLKYNGIYYLHIYAADRVVETTKNTSKKAMTLRFDNTPPVIESLVRDSSDWKQKHSFNFKIKDEHSGISVIKYCLSKSTSMPTLSNACWKVYNISREANKKEISGGKQLEEKVNDIHYLYLYVEDSVAETVKNSSSKRIELKYDNEKPVIDNIQVDTQNWKRKHKVTASISDGPSGISEVRSTWCTSSVRSNCGAVSSWKLHTSTVNGTYLFEENTNTGTYYLHIYVADKTADIKNETYAVTASMLFDNVAPKVSLSVDSDKWEHSHVVTINSSDTGSGVVNHTYTIDKYNESKKAYEKFENAKTIMSNVIEIGCLAENKKTCADKSEIYTGKFRVEVYATDRVALLSEIKQIEILLDNSRPKVNITSITSENAWAKAHTVTLEIKDAQSGLNELVYKWCKASGECTKEEKISFNGETKVERVVEGKNIDGEYYLSIIVTDKVEDKIGNTGYKVTKALKFDNTSPILLDINNKELKNIVNNKLLVKARDAHTSVDKVLISWGTDIKNVVMSKDANGNYVYEFPKEVEGKIKVTLTLIDTLENKESEEYEIEVDTVSIIAMDKYNNKLDKILNFSISRPIRVDNKVNYEIEEMVDIEVEEDKVIVVVSEEVENIEVSVNEEEYKKLDNKVIELANSEVCVISIKFSYANEDLKKLFVLNKKNNKWTVNKK